MAEQQETGPRSKKVPPAAVIGAGVAIFASLFVVLTSNGGKSDKAPEAAQAQPALAVPGPPQDGTASTQSDPIAAPAAQPPDPPVQADTAGGSKIHFSDDVFFTFDASFPGPASDPVIAPLHKEAESLLARLKAEARDELADRKKTGALLGAGWNGDVRWRYTAKADGIVSLFGSRYLFQGGAHGATAFGTVIARQNGETLTFNDMLTLKRSPSPAMTVAICEALKAEKQKKIRAQTVFDDPISCIGPNANVKLDNPLIALAPSDQPGKFGGAYVVFQQYEVGAYAEGSYVVTIQQEIFAEDLRPEFKPLFAGVAPPFQ